MVYLVGHVGIEIADGVIRDRGQMDNRFEALEISGLDVPHVGADLIDLEPALAEPALEQARVEPDHGVARLLEQQHQRSADIAIVACDEDSHSLRPLVILSKRCQPIEVHRSARVAFWTRSRGGPAESYEEPGSGRPR